MSVPNDYAVISAVYASGDYDLKTHEGHAAFVDAAVRALHGVDANWGHLKKKPGQANIHGHGEDSVLYKLPDGTAWAVDFIQAAGGANPSLRWGPDPVAYYTHADWLDPKNHDAAPPAPTPQYPPYPGDEVFDLIGVKLFADYALAANPPNALMGRWFGRTIYDWLAKNEPTLDASVTKHRAEWRKILGLPPL